MAKKRRTKEQKIIARLRRQLASQKPLVAEKEKQKYQKIQAKKGSKTKIKTPELIKKTTKIKKKSSFNGNELFFYDPSLIKKDLLKTLILTFVFLIIIGLFYWGIELEGTNLIREFFHL